MEAKKPLRDEIDPDLPEGLRRPRTRAIPAPQRRSDLASNRGRLGPQDAGGVTQDGRGQVQPKDKNTAQRS
jgi:hypothetical protein